jgi:CheY-like chemotaxis protein
MNAEHVVPQQADQPHDSRQQTTETSKGLLRLKAGAPSPPASGIAVKSVLLLDSNLRSRESRAKIMRHKGVRVDTVATPAAARVRLAAEKYNLILVDCGRDPGTTESLVQEIKAKNSRQLVGFLVGSPLFISKTSSGDTSHRQPGPAIVTRPQKLAPAPEARSFGQRIRDAEAEAAGE